MKVSAPKDKDGEGKVACKKPVTRPNFKDFKKNMMKSKVQAAVKDKEKGK